MRGATDRDAQRGDRLSISIHAPLAGRDPRKVAFFAHREISIHAPLAGRDPTRSQAFCGSGHFNPRAPCGARPGAQRTLFHDIAISIHAPLTGRDAASLFCLEEQYISIHAPLTGRDKDGSLAVETLYLISIHAPLTGRDQKARDTVSLARDFNPRAPYGARPKNIGNVATIVNFNPRAPYGARHIYKKPANAKEKFQSTRPLRGATNRTPKGGNTTMDFNPRAPCGARLAQRRISRIVICISIHAPLAGRDSTARCRQPALSSFQSTRPSRGATGRYLGVPRRDDMISIHAPLAGRDPCSTLWTTRAIYFNPRAPRGARRKGQRMENPVIAISIHAPLAGRDGISAM